MSTGATGCTRRRSKERREKIREFCDVLCARARVWVNWAGSLAFVDTIHGASVEDVPGTGLWEAVHLTANLSRGPSEMSRCHCLNVTLA